MKLNVKELTGEIKEHYSKHPQWQQYSDRKKNKLVLIEISRLVSDSRFDSFSLFDIFLSVDPDAEDIADLEELLKTQILTQEEIDDKEILRRMFQKYKEG